MTTIGNALRALGKLVKRYPVRAQAIVQAAIGTATAFGLGWSAQQVGAVVVLSAVTLAFLTEQAVTPVSEPSLPAGTSVNVVNPGTTPDSTVTV